MESETASLETVLTIADAARASSGHRRCSEADMAWVEAIRCLRATGMPIARIRRCYELVRIGRHERERLALLEEHRESVRAQLAEVQGHLAFVERKIATYEELIDG